MILHQNRRDKINIINMVPSGMEPHHWEPSPKDVAGLSHAELFIYNGAGMRPGRKVLTQ